MGTHPEGKHIQKISEVCPDENAQRIGNREMKMCKMRIKYSNVDIRQQER